MGHRPIIWTNIEGVSEKELTHVEHMDPVGLGAIAAPAGGSSVTVGAARVGFWGALAMAVTASVGALFGTTM
jgi:hypothetical protein